MYKHISREKQQSMPQNKCLKTSKGSQDFVSHRKRKLFTTYDHKLTKTIIILISILSKTIPSETSKTSA